MSEPIPVPDFTGIPSEYLEGELFRREPQGSAAILVFADRIITKGCAGPLRLLFEKLSERIDMLCYHLDSLPDCPSDPIVAEGPNVESVAVTRRASGRNTIDG